MEELEKIKLKVHERSDTDKIMWFSMWFLVSIVTFGLACFPMFYYLIERRNQHFSRQRELQELILNCLGRESEFNSMKRRLPTRNAKLLSASIVLIIPIFWIAYFLSKDLLLHERRQKVFFRKFMPDKILYQQQINIKKHVILTLATFGIGIIYWLYKIFNLYNNHFHEQREIENRIVELIETKINHPPK